MEQLPSGGDLKVGKLGQIPEEHDVRAAETSKTNRTIGDIFRGAIHALLETIGFTCLDKKVDGIKNPQADTSNKRQYYDEKFQAIYKQYGKMGMKVPSELRVELKVGTRTSVWDLARNGVIEEKRAADLDSKLSKLQKPLDQRKQLVDGQINLAKELLSLEHIEEEDKKVCDNIISSLQRGRCQFYELEANKRILGGVNSRIQEKADPGYQDKQFEKLKSMLKSKGFDASSYSNIQSLQEKGHPLHFVVQGNLDMGFLKTLVEAGADVHQKDENGNTVLDLIMKKNHQAMNRSRQIVPTGIPEDDKKMISYLLSKDLMPSESDGSLKSSLSCLIGQCTRYDENWLTEVLNKVVTEENMPETAHAIVENSNLPNDLVVSLLEKGMPVDTPDKDGRSLLYKAVDKMDTRFASTLIQYKADPNLAGTIQRSNIPSDIPDNRKPSQKSFTPLTPLELAKGKQDLLKTTLENMKNLKVVSQSDLDKADSKGVEESKKRIGEIPVQGAGENVKEVTTAKGETRRVTTSSNITPDRKTILQIKAGKGADRPPLKSADFQKEEIAELKEQTADKLKTCDTMVRILSASPPK